MTASATGNPDGASGTATGRYGHHCFKWKNDYGFVVGGNLKQQQSDGTWQDSTSCSSQWPPLKLLNLTTYQWQTSHDPNGGAAFQVNKNISQFIGGR